MSGWFSFWQGLVIVSLTAFALLSVFVMIGGARDVLSMFRQIDRQHEQSEVKQRTPNESR